MTEAREARTAIRRDMPSRSRVFMPLSGRLSCPALDISARVAYLPSLIIILDLDTFIGGGILGTVVLGAMAALISMLVWGRWLVDLIAAGT